MINKTFVSAQGLCIMALHHQYFTPVFEIEVGLSQFNYHMHYDHDVIDGTLTDCKVFDLTNYPRTLDPSTAEKASISKRHLYQR